MEILLQSLGRKCLTNFSRKVVTVSIDITEFSMDPKLIATFYWSQSCSIFPSE